MFCVLDHHHLCLPISPNVPQAIELQQYDNPAKFPIMSDLPVFTPISKSPILTAAEIQHLFQPANPRVAKAEAQSRAGDISVLPLLQNLVQKEKTEAQTLSTCLLAAVTSGNPRIVQQLLAFGVSVNLPSVRTAITDKALDIFVTFPSLRRLGY